MNERGRQLRPINGAFRALFDTSLICLLTTASAYLKAGFIRRCQVAWGFIPRRKERPPPVFQRTPITVFDTVRP